MLSGLQCSSSRTRVPHSQLLLYMALAPEEKIKFTEGGERAVANFEAGKAGYEARAFRGLGVFTSSPFEVSDDQDSVQMLQRSTQVGEFYRMAPPAVFNGNKLPGTYMDLLIYDEEADKLQHVTFREALYATCGIKKVDGNRFGTVSQTDYNLYEKTLAASTTPGKPANVGTKEALLEVLNGDDLDAIANLVESGVWLPVCITIARPFIEHTMMSSVLTVAGRDTGATLFGPAGKSLHPTFALSLLLRDAFVFLCSSLQTCRSRPTPP